ncbi:tyrosyl-tRNA synthetase [Reichenbachiella agariperforans]|uniref:Tyrosine--tRNA ligase n=1 Tax=Reichenbachiella agariperforans TaxID=156994 RepID=A0A1M6Q5R5_REIAG|nr:tyrosine--tRNA ligase [Reichenbachiella agariperforans]RJE72964.1 tyrosine--tRNA ligase [Reichenbachiella sp. MSK19-1]SHK15531.1 tyrosyl-tRNA synthetase [Reichenbachiella agariperforans]
MIKDFVAELTWRGMIHDKMPGVQEQMNKEMVSAYIGFDPTADSLHIGHLVQIMTLVHLQRSGHKPLALVGGATGMVGDPSGKSAERNLLSEDILNHNLASVKKQLEQFLDFDCGDNSAEMVNNYDWFKDFNFLDFIRDVGKHISVNYMLAKDSVKTRLETGMSFTEFTYQLVQGYDFYWLNQNKNCKVQLGGSDQWGNIVTGTELIRRKAQGEAWAITTPLIRKADGTKFGKTAGGNVWLDKDRTSPYEFYQYWLNSSDEDSENYIKIFTLKEKEEIDNLIAEHKEAPHLRILQKAVAEDITVRVHSQEDLEMAIKASSILFGKSTAEDLASLDEKTLLSVFEGVPQATISQADYAALENVTDLLSEGSDGVVFPSKGEARRMIKGGGVSINKTKVESADQAVDFSLLNDKYLLAQKGKKNYYLITVAS